MACSLVAERPLSKPITAVRHRQREPLFMPLCGHLAFALGKALLALGVAVAVLEIREGPERVA
jgi:hypothetical protein